jgi:hypothetical protein
MSKIKKIMDKFKQKKKSQIAEWKGEIDFKSNLVPG